MIGDLPEADAKPPSNMLFVCKLNPVTTEEDLEIIFSRWGGGRLTDGGGGGVGG
jgi:peptidyl-prolyl cis-trans isomerase-like 4